MRVGNGVQTDATTPNNVGRAVQIVALCFGDHGTKEMLGVVG